MPNWVFNKLEFSGTEEKVKEILEYMQDFSFQKVIPMPKTLEIDESSGNDYQIMYYLTDSLTKTIDELDEKTKSILDVLVQNSYAGDDWHQTVYSRLKTYISTNDTVMFKPNLELAKRLVDNYKKYGSTTWYHWAIDNWGTKWDCCSLEMDNDNFMICFDTAWNAPFPVIDKLSTMFPDVVIKHSFADEDFGYNCGIYSVKNGHILNKRFPDENNSGFDIAIEVHGYTDENVYNLYGLTKTENGYKYIEPCED